MDIALGVMAKAPRTGEVKTRLVPPLAPAGRRTDALLARTSG